MKHHPLPVRCLVVAAAVALGITLSGCGSGDDDTVTAPEKTETATSESGLGLPFEGADGDHHLLDSIRGEFGPKLIIDKSAPPSQQLTKIAERVIGFANGEERTLGATDLTFALGGAAVELANPDKAAGRRSKSDFKSWALTCPGGLYAESACPINWLTPLRLETNDQVDLILSTEPHQIGCAPKRRAPVADLPRVVIRPADVDACLRDFSLVLYSNDEGRVTGVDLTLGAP